MAFHDRFLYQSPTVSYRFGDQDFDRGFWCRHVEGSELQGGRGGSVKISLQGENYVLRQYLRGGWMAKFLHDQYLWSGLEKTRPYLENHIVELALQHHLPVAAVAAYRVQRQGLIYRAAIISRYLENRGTLAEILMTSALDADLWQALGAVIRRLHDAGIFHADLNANNILIDDRNEFHLIDFDKAYSLSPTSSRLFDNVNRLQRSLLKIAALQAERNQLFYFSQKNWENLMQGYRLQR